MMPMSPTHALAIARAEEVQRRAGRAYLPSTEAAAPSRVTSALRSLPGHLREALIPARVASARSTAVCCA